VGAAHVIPREHPEEGVTMRTGGGGLLEKVAVGTKHRSKKTKRSMGKTTTQKQQKKKGGGLKGPSLK